MRRRREVQPREQYVLCVNLCQSGSRAAVPNALRTPAAKKATRAEQDYAEEEEPAGGEGEPLEEEGGAEQPAEEF